jgi:D-alanine-D-alanine ligase
MSAVRVVILYNEPVLPLDHPDAESEHEVLSTVAFVEQTLLNAEFQVSRLGLGENPNTLFAGLHRQKADVVFNLYEGTAVAGHTEAYVAAALEWLKVPFTGSSSLAISLSRSKHLAKTLLEGAGLPTPRFYLVDGMDGQLPTKRDLQWPLIVKLATEHASVGLDQDSVVTNQEALLRRVAYLRRSYSLPVLVEEYVEGREFNVALIENPDLQVLPLAEIGFANNRPEQWPIVTYIAKWKTESREYQDTMPRCPAEVDPCIKVRLESLARQAYRLLECRDYARIDFRVPASGMPSVLEVNPNPDYNPAAGLPQTMAAAGLSHVQFTVDLVRAALARSRSRS